MEQKTRRRVAKKVKSFIIDKSGKEKKLTRKANLWHYECVHDLLLIVVN